MRGRLGDGSPDCQHHDFNPRPLAGATLTVFLCSEIRPHFNPRPLAGATAGEHPVGVSPFDFNPRPLAGATAVRPRISPGAGISIHAPLRGRLTTEMPLRHIKHFNPRPLAGATEKKTRVRGSEIDFNPRPLAGATKMRNAASSNQKISIHAPLRGRPCPI